MDAMKREGLSEEGQRALVLALNHDGPLWTSHPSSLVSGLLARVRGHPELVKAEAQWRKEVYESGQPFVESLRPIPLHPAQISELSVALEPRLHEMREARFLDEQTLILGTKDEPGQRLWQWRPHRLEHRESSTPEVRDYPVFNEGPWQPPTMQRAVGEAPVELPCPKDSSSNARLSLQSGLALVYGTLDEYDGGFVWFADLQTLKVQKRFSTSTPVWRVLESVDGSALIAETSAALVYWKDDHPEILLRRAELLALSPSGDHVAIRAGTNIQIWSPPELPARKVNDRLPARFSPDGARLVSGDTLYEAQSGQAIAQLEVRLGRYLEGGPPRPWMHMGNAKLSCLHGGLRVWRSEDGAPVSTGIHRRFPIFTREVVYSASGNFVAAIARDERVHVFSIPELETVAQLSFELPAIEAIALSPDGAFVAALEEAMVEVRALDGAQVMRKQLSSGSDAQPEDSKSRSLRFVDKETIEVDDKAYRLDGSAVSAAHSSASGWRVEPRGLFIEEKTGTQIWLPLHGSWTAHPKDPKIMACEGGHVRLHS